jgi:hypothetical protein
MPPEFVPKPQSYIDRVTKALRIVKIAQYRPDQRLAVRELCEAVLELATALQERELGQGPPPEPKPAAKTPTA